MGRWQRTLVVGALAAATLLPVTAVAPIVMSAGVAAAAQSSGAAQPAAGTRHQTAQTPFGVGSVSVCAQAAQGTARCDARLATNASGKPLASTAPTSGYYPADLQSAYQLASTGGSGQTVAIVDAYDDPNAEVDLGTYRSQFGLSACTTANGCFRKVNQTGGTSYPSANGSWAQEISLDLDMVSAICPGCHILLVEANSSRNGDLGAAVNTAATLGANAISNSYGGSEYSGETTADTSYYKHPGIMITASSGDGGYGVEYPAASQYVTAVGGTSLSKGSTTPRGWTETAWSGAGSGCSQYEPKPSWQTDTGCSRRTVADVSADANPNTGVAVYDSYSYQGASGWLVFGGTSVASPIVASVYALANNEASLTYGSRPYTNTAWLNDVTSGSNGRCRGSYLCTAGTGYDGPTGLGTPIGTVAFGGTASLPTVTGVSPSSGSVLGGTVVTVTGTNFYVGSGFAVSFGGVPATSVSVTSPSQLTATAPPGSLGNVDVTVTNPAGTSSKTSSDVFTNTRAPYGSDISYPQCGTSFPPTSFGIAGVTGGRVFSPNSCLGGNSGEMAWATGTGEGSLYMNTGDPSTVSAEWNNPTGNPEGFANYTVVPPPGGYQTCSTTDTGYGCDWDYGWNSAQYAYQQAVSAASSASIAPSVLASMRWWLDVETANSWTINDSSVTWSATAADAASMQGALAGLQYAQQQYATANSVSVSMPTPGIYTSSSAWTTIMGSATFTNPNWVPGATTQSGAQSNCALAAPTGSEVMLSQWTTSLDNDFACPVSDQTYNKTPSVTTGSATNVTSSSATLNGTVNPNGADTTYYFEYGTTTSYGTNSATTDVGMGTSSTPVSFNVGGLQAGTTYHVQLVATNVNGTTYGGDVTLLTAGAANVVLDAGQSLSSGQSINSPNGQFTLVMGTDGNLVEYQGSTPVWSTGTSGTGNWAIMQSDGNFVVYNTSNSPLWNSKTYGNPGSYLALSNGGTLSVDSTAGVPLWGVPNALVPDTLLSSGQSIDSPNGQFTLVMGTDGNLVEYQGSTPVWSTGTSGTGNWAIMQSDGNFVVYNTSNSPLWNSKTYGNPGSYLSLTDTGVLSVDTVAGAAVWTAQ